MWLLEKNACLHIQTTSNSWFQKKVWFQNNMICQTDNSLKLQITYNNNNKYKETIVPTMRWVLAHTWVKFVEIYDKWCMSRAREKYPPNEQRFWSWPKNFENSIAKRWPNSRPIKLSGALYGQTYGAVPFHKFLITTFITRKMLKFKWNSGHLKRKLGPKATQANLSYFRVTWGRG